MRRRCRCSAWTSLLEELYVVIDCIKKKIFKNSYNVLNTEVVQNDRKENKISKSEFP